MFDGRFLRHRPYAAIGGMGSGDSVDGRQNEVSPEHGVSAGNPMRTRIEFCGVSTAGKSTPYAAMPALFQ